MNRRISQKDIAKKLGVSTALVSYVLNNKKEGRIKRSVAEKIRQTAVDMNYHTNQIARSLKTNKTFTIGLIVADIANPFSSGLARIIENEAEKNNYTVLFGSSDESLQRSDKLLETFLNRQVDGLIIAPGGNATAQVRFLQEQQVPFVLVDRYFPGIDTNYVALDNYAGGLAATQHLIDCGRKRIGLISFDTTLFNIQERKRGYVEAMENNGVAVDPHLLIETNSGDLKANVEKGIDSMLAQRQRVDALLFANNAIATHGLRHISQLGLRVPKDLAIASFDKTDALDLFYAPLTYIDQPLAEMGRLATKILLETIEGEKATSHINLPAELVIRSSTVGFE